MGIQSWERTKQSAAGLHWLATLLTGRQDVAADVTAEALTAAVDSDAFFSDWASAWTRRVVIEKALAAVRQELTRSKRRSGSAACPDGLPPRSWALDPGTTRSDLERALLSIDIFPRAALVLLVFEHMPLEHVAALLDSDPLQVRAAQEAGLRALAINLAEIPWHGPAALSGANARSVYQCL